MIGHDEVGAIADDQVRADGHALSAQSFDLFHQGHRVQYHAVADDALFAGMQDARGDQVENEFLVSRQYGMPRVVASLAANDEVRFFGQKVDDFAFAFVAPLGSDQNSVCHN